MNQTCHYLLRSGVVAALAATGALAYVSAFMLRFAGELPVSAWSILEQTIVIVLVAKVAVALWQKADRGWNRSATFHDLVVIARSAACGSALITLLDALALPSVTIPRSVVMLDGGVTLLLWATSRGATRLARDLMWRVRQSDAETRVLIVGANDAGEAILRAIAGNRKLAYRPLGFIDINTRRVTDSIGGLPVLGGLADVAVVARRHNAAEILVTSSELPGKALRKLIARAAEAGCRVKALPSLGQLLSDQVEIQPRPVAIADLLRRPSIDLDLEQARRWIQGRVVLVTGAAGSIGSEICRQMVRLAPGKLLLIDRSETGQFYLDRELRQLDGAANLQAIMADVTDVGRMRQIFEDHRPAVIFHAAAYKHVPLMEDHPGEAVKNIVLATRTLCDLADEFAAERFVMISTDKAVNPTSVMGSCKRLAEQYAQARAVSSPCRFITVRFGNVLDSAGSVVPIFREQIARGGPVTVTHPDMVRYFMMIPEAAQLVIHAGGMGRGGEIFVLDMGEPVRILDLARDMIRLSGLREQDDIEIRITGLRPGEKLYEELYANEESHTRTAHPKIFASTAAPRNLLQVINGIGRLEPLVNSDPKAVRQALREVVPPSHFSAPCDARAA